MRMYHCSSANSSSRWESIYCEILDIDKWLIKVNLVFVKLGFTCFGSYSWHVFFLHCLIPNYFYLYSCCFVMDYCNLEKACYCVICLNMKLGKRGLISDYICIVYLSVIISNFNIFKQLTLMMSDLDCWLKQILVLCLPSPSLQTVCSCNNNIFILWIQCIFEGKKKNFTIKFSLFFITHLQFLINFTLLWNTNQWDLDSKDLDTNYVI